MSSAIIYKALKASQKGQNYAFATIIDSTLKGTPRKAGAKMIVFDDGSSEGSIGGGRNEKAAIAEKPSRHHRAEGIYHQRAAVKGRW